VRVVGSVGWSAAISRRAVTRSGVAAAYYERPDLRAEHLVNPILDPLLEINADHPVTTPLSWLEADGSIRVLVVISSSYTVPNRVPTAIRVTASSAATSPSIAAASIRTCSYRSSPESATDNEPSHTATTRGVVLSERSS
jgi:hypothetical protein